MGFQSFLANLKGPARVATVHVPESASTENVIHEGNLDYTQEKGGNDSLPSYQGVYQIFRALLLNDMSDFKQRHLVLPSKESPRSDTKCLGSL